MAVEPQLVDYIKKAKEVGQADEQTRALLYKNGWTEAEVSDAFAVINQPKPQLQPQPQTQPQSQFQPKPQPQVQQQPQYQPKPQIQQQQAEPEPQVQEQAQPQYQPQPQSKLQYEPQSSGGFTQSNMPKARNPHLVLKLLIVLIILIIVGGVGYFALQQTDFLKSLFNQAAPTQTQTKSNENTNASATANNFTEPNFAQYNLETTKCTPALPNYTIAISELTNL
ncbi:MAG: hypothetical protein ABSF55_04330, partial [Candidatus Staskawiczbacteria bacterium]